jgi:hypothetical protein
MSVGETHYDHKCVAAVKPGGFIYGWFNQVAYPPALPLSIRFRQADLCCKIMEQSDLDNPEHRALSKAMADLCKQINAESGRCNVPGTEPAFTEG